MLTAYVGSVANRSKSRLLVGKEFIAQMNAEKNGQRTTCRFISMNICFAERNLRVHPRSRSSAAMTVTYGTGFGEKRIQRRL